MSAACGGVRHLSGTDSGTVPSRRSPAKSGQERGGRRYCRSLLWFRLFSWARTRRSVLRVTFMLPTLTLLTTRRRVAWCLGQKGLSNRPAPHRLVLAQWSEKWQHVRCSKTGNPTSLWICVPSPGPKIAT